MTMTVTRYTLSLDCPIPWPDNPPYLQASTSRFQIEALQASGQRQTTTTLTSVEEGERWLAQTYLACLYGGDQLYSLPTFSKAILALSASLPFDSTSTYADILSKHLLSARSLDDKWRSMIPSYLDPSSSDETGGVFSTEERDRLMEVFSKWKASVVPPSVARKDQGEADGAGMMIDGDRAGDSAERDGGRSESDRAKGGWMKVGFKDWLANLEVAETELQIILHLALMVYTHEGSQVPPATSTAPKQQQPISELELGQGAPNERGDMDLDEEFLVPKINPSKRKRKDKSKKKKPKKVDHEEVLDILTDRLGVFQAVKGEGGRPSAIGKTEKGKGKEGTDVRGELDEVQRFWNEVVVEYFYPKFADDQRISFFLESLRSKFFTFHFQEPTTDQLSSRASDPTPVRLATATPNLARLVALQDEQDERRRRLELDEKVKGSPTLAKLLNKPNFIEPTANEIQVNKPERERTFRRSNSTASSRSLFSKNKEREVSFGGKKAVLVPKSKASGQPAMKATSATAAGEPGGTVKDQKSKRKAASPRKRPAGQQEESQILVHATPQKAKLKAVRAGRKPINLLPFSTIPEGSDADGPHENVISFAQLGANFRPGSRPFGSGIGVGMMDINPEFDELDLLRRPGPHQKVQHRKASSSSNARSFQTRDSDREVDIEEDYFDETAEEAKMNEDVEMLIRGASPQKGTGGDNVGWGSILVPGTPSSGKGGFGGGCGSGVPGTPRGVWVAPETPDERVLLD